MKITQGYSSDPSCSIASVVIVLKKGETSGHKYCTVLKFQVVVGVYVGSDRWRAVADLRVEFVRCLVLWRLLQHVVLHDHLLVSIDWRVRVVRVVP